VNGGPKTRADLTDDWTRNVCKIGQGAACCRYLTMGPDGWNCERNASLKATIDERVAAGQFTARGDNCEGLPTEPRGAPKR
jgi:hypothetical protein